MFTYYDDRSVHITSAEIRVDQQRYPLADLHRIWQRRGARSWSALAGRGMVGVAFLAPVVTAILGLVTALTINASPTVTIALIGGSILVGLIIIPVADLLLGLLDASYDALRVGRIHRALRRAVEAALDAEALAESHPRGRDGARRPAVAASGTAASELVREQRHGKQARRPQVQTGHGYRGGRQIERAYRPTGKT
jgi:hypothetical protein